MTTRPNVVLILTDDHAAHAIGAYGSIVNETPRIDELAHGGAVLENCFATNSLCSPSRASILTGTYSHVNGVTTLVTPIDAAQPTFITHLKAAGYRTAVVGKWHMGDGDGHDPQGFDYWDVLIDQGEYHNPRFLNPSGLRVEEGYATDVITDLALAWLETLDDQTPWCVLIWHKAPHRPWEPAPRHLAERREPVPLPATWDDDLATRSSSARRAAMRIADHLTAEDLKMEPPPGLTYDEEAVWKYQRYMEDYLRCVEAVDENVGRVTDWLHERELFDDTLVVYASDQGFFLGDHGWFDKRFMYEESIRMPVIMSYPRRLPAGTREEGILTNVDIAQTVLDATGIDAPQRMQGRSILGAIEAGETGRRDGFYYRYWEHDDVFHKAPAHYGYRTDRYKLIYYYNDGLGIPGTGEFTYAGEWEMYDLETDPDETCNVVHDPHYADIARHLRRRLLREQRDVGDRRHASDTEERWEAQLGAGAEGTGS
ncbi:sulfatase [Demequina sp. NBRC 110051]|uniref:sulfatase family protein n=1 Tax=Demequina sp. NBRC 110051 TaxID=1570340 RepID=UPI000A04AAED|nr:sulfatase [Demequina sp. NBRC 110051]